MRQKNISDKSGKSKGKKESETDISNKILIEDMDLSPGSKLLIEMAYGIYGVEPYNPNESEITDLDISPGQRALMLMS